MAAFFRKIASGIGDFFVVVVKSCYDMEWFRTVRTRRTSEAFGYFLAFHVVLTLIGAMLVTPGAFRFKNELIKFAGRSLPEGARITVSDGRFSANFPTPHDVGSPEYPVIIDPSVVGNDPPEIIGKGNGILIGRDAVFIQQDGDEWNTYAMKSFPDMSVGRDDVVGWLNAYGAGALVAALALFTLFYLLFIVAGNALYVLVASLVALLLGKLWKVPLSYRQWLAVGFHAITLPILVNIAFITADLRIPFAFSFIYFMFIASVLADERLRPTEGVDEPKKPVRRSRIARKKPLPPEPPRDGDVKV